MHNIQKSALADQAHFRNYLGQISQYMYLAKVKYAFLTTYDQTIFLKQEPHPTKQSQWALWHSNVISHTTASEEVDPKAKFDAYRNRVSLRECFLFLW
ncbi:hypothetical protein VTN02DRAFT_6463 [Thermoascus thermophilus]